MINNFKKICDVKQAISNMGNSTDLFIKHFNKFKNSGTNTINQLKELIDNDNFSEAFILCHSLKGLSGMLGFTSLKKHAEEGEYLFKELAAQIPANKTKTSDSEPVAISDNQHITIQRTYSAIVRDIEAICKFQLHL